MATNDFSNDRPLTRPDEDRLNRTPFVKRIATLLQALPSDSGLVVGIHGPWGDGKTTVLNLLRSELSPAEEIILLDFNPWRFTDETTMLAAFFNEIANTVRAKITTKGELIADWIEKIGHCVSVVDKRGGAISKIFKNKANPGLEELRRRLFAALNGIGKRIIVLIDDIDRLDKQETHKLFRLIKACADFPNVCYVLAFDEVAVAESLGERYGGGGEASGRAFLEKIIQVPLKLPIASIEDLRAMCFEQINQALESAEIELSQEEVGAFVSGFNRGISLRLDTPRQVKRYGNALMFALPMLKDEVNTTDLLLLEAVRAFYPTIYVCLRLNHTVFSGVDSEQAGRLKEDSQPAQLLNPILEKLDESEQKAAKSILVDLFPRLSGTFGYSSFGSDWLDNWFKAKRICSPEYCPRYFTYAIPLNDLRDSELETIIADATRGEENIVFEALANHFKRGCTRSVIEKLHSLVTEIDIQAVPYLCKGIAVSALHMPNPQVLFSFGEAPSRAAMLISALIKRLPDKSARVDLAKQVVQCSEPLWFASECLRWLYVTDKKDKADHNTLTKDQIAEVGKTLVVRIKERAAKGELLFNVDISQEETLLYEWSHIEGREPVQQHLEAVFKKDPKQIIQFLKAIAPQSWGDKDVIPKIGGIERSQLKNINLIFDLDLLASLIREHCTGEFDNPQWNRGNGESVEQRLAEQFMFCYKKWKTDGVPSNEDSESKTDENANG